MFCFLVTSMAYDCNFNKMGLWGTVTQAERKMKLQISHWDKTKPSPGIVLRHKLLVASLLPRF